MVGAAAPQYIRHNEERYGDEEDANESPFRPAQWSVGGRRGPGGRVLDESDLSGNFTDEYVYFGGMRIAHRTVSTQIEQGVDIGSGIAVQIKQQLTVIANAQGQSVTYIFRDQSKFVLTGNHPFRDNNPGDLRSGGGSIGRDGGFAIYPSLDAGLDALNALLTGKYANASIADTMKSFAPGSDGNNPVKYAAFLATAIGVPVSTKISSL